MKASFFCLIGASSRGMRWRGEKALSRLDSALPVDVSNQGAVVSPHKQMPPQNQGQEVLENQHHHLEFRQVSVFPRIPHTAYRFSQAGSPNPSRTYP